MAAWSVAALLQAGSDALWARFGPLAVRGELSALTRAASGHWYFSLKDEAGAPALLRCAMFRRSTMLVDFTPADGQRVEVRGRLDLYAARGELQMVVEAMARVGQGALYEEFLRLRARLEAQGLFDAARKRPLPKYPRRLGVVTSPAAAALRDVLTALQRRAPHVAVVVYPSLVQGAEAPASLVQALAGAAMRSAEDGIDALLVVRGGGSLEDLWAFNDERVVRAIAAFPRPVVCGIGHETDVTLADWAADVRAPTPTAAAELAAPPRDELAAMLDNQAARLWRAAARRLQIQAQGLDGYSARLGQPTRVLLGQRARLDALAHRLARAPRPALESASHRVQAAAARLAAAATLRRQQARAWADTLALRLRGLDPRHVLGRGYAWVEDGQGRAITSAGALAPGVPIRAVWADGSASAQVTHVAMNPAEPDPAGPQSPQGGRAAGTAA